jgi:O-antigen ligase
VNERAAALAASAVFLVTPVVMTLTASSGAFEESVRSATGENSTLEWRTESWQTLIESHSSGRDLLAGLPAGTSLERRIGGQIATESPHSIYVDSLLSFGILGPILIVWLWFFVVRNRRNAAGVLELSSVVVVLIVLSQMLFGVTNRLGPIQGLLLGMLLQAAAHTRVTRASSAPNAGLERLR